MDENSPSVTASSYCTPEARIWVTEEGIEDPTAVIIAIWHINTIEDLGQTRKTPQIYLPGENMMVHNIEFEYDGGQYIGCMSYLTSTKNNIKIPMLRGEIRASMVIQCIPSL